MIRKSTRRSGLGFTLIELMIVVAIIGILAAIAIPKFADLIRKSKEGATKGNLGAIRSAISIYYGDNEGQYPVDKLECLIAGQEYLNSIPKAATPNYHPDSNAVVNKASAAVIADSDDGWVYANSNLDTLWGSLWVACTHTDSKSTMWTAY